MISWQYYDDSYGSHEEGHGDSYDVDDKDF